MAEYLSANRSELRICGVIGSVVEWPSLMLPKPVEFKIRLEKEKLVSAINPRQHAEGHTLAKIFSPDKVVELMLVCGIYDDAVYFLSSKIRFYLYH